MRRHDRTIDPGGHGRGIREDRLGSVPESALVREQQRQGRYEWQTPLILTRTRGPWVRENIAASATNTMRLLALITSSTNPATPNTLYNGAAGSGSSFTTGNPGRVWGGAIWTPSTITAGKVTLGVQIGGVTHLISDCYLDSTSTIGKDAQLGWRRGIPFAAGQTITPVLVTDSAFLPTTTDVSAWLDLAWEEPA